MLRLFSMFPAGAPGIALLILRIALAAAILDRYSDFAQPSVHPILCLALAAQGILLCIGFLTPFVSVITCMFAIGLLLAGPADARFLTLCGLNAAAIALLGPGAYSLDARLFGRREIVFQPTARPGRQ